MVIIFVSDYILPLRSLKYSFVLFMILPNTYGGQKCNLRAYVSSQNIEIGRIFAELR